MFIYQKFSIAHSDHFIPSEFPQLQASIQQVIEQLTTEPDIKTEMVLSFVKDHRIDSKLVKDHPKLAGLISTKSLPLQGMEDLFEAASKNPVFKKELEEHIRNCFTVTSSVNVPEFKN
jgi:hypothetical protein